MRPSRNKVYRLYAPDLAAALPAGPAGATGAPVALPEGEVHHALHVLRLRQGEEVECFDGAGRSAIGQVETAGRHDLRVVVRLVMPPRPRPLPIVHLAFAEPKGNRLDWLLEKATELGVASLRPVHFRRSVVGSEAISENKLQRWLGHCIAAAKQSGVNFLPEIHPPMALPEFVRSMGILPMCTTGILPVGSQSLPTGTLAIVGDLSPSATPIRKALADWRGREIVLLVGPEGGIEDDEAASARTAGFLFGQAWSDYASHRDRGRGPDGRRDSIVRRWERAMRRVARAALAGVLVAALAGCKVADPPPVVVDRPRAGGTDVTFLVAADSHVGADGMEALNRVQIEQMNAISGTAYPPAIGGQVAQPLGLLFAGDLTDHGTEGEWKTFEQLYGLTGVEGLLKYPLFECTGNHDRTFPFVRPVLAEVARRHGGLTYSWNWSDVHIVCVDEYPDAERVKWLIGDLAAAGRSVPVVVYFHYSILGPFSEWWSQSQKDALAAALAGYNVVGIFHGHYHGSYAYKWRGLDVFNIGSPRWIFHRFLVVHVTDTRFTVAAWDWDHRRWDWCVDKPINQPN